MGIEVPHFDSQDGSGLILHLLGQNGCQASLEAESASAVQLSERLSGHALALSTMAGLIHRRQWSTQEVLKLYEKDRERVHVRLLDPLWHLSFEVLAEKEFQLLGILSFLWPDAIQHELVACDKETNLPALISFCKDDDL